MAKNVDARGLSCPEPVILLQKAIREGLFPIEVWADTVTVKENVSRMGRSQGFTTEVIQMGNEFKIILKK